MKFDLKISSERFPDGSVLTFISLVYHQDKYSHHFFTVVSYLDIDGASNLVMKSSL